VANRVRDVNEGVRVRGRDEPAAAALDERRERGERDEGDREASGERSAPCGHVPLGRAAARRASSAGGTFSVRVAIHQ
jgi:hypothetical protein